MRLALLLALAAMAFSAQPAFCQGQCAKPTCNTRDASNCGPDCVCSATMPPAPEGLCMPVLLPKGR